MGFALHNMTHLAVFLIAALCHSPRVYVPVAPGTNLQFQGPIQNPPPPAHPPGQSRFFRHYRR